LAASTHAPSEHVAVQGPPDAVKPVAQSDSDTAEPLGTVVGKDEESAAAGINRLDVSHGNGVHSAWAAHEPEVHRPGLAIGYSTTQT
jgi:hypothetical protein